MAENNHSCVSSMITTFFAGALLGAGLALIFAPVTGKEARHTIIHQFEELKDKIKELERKMHKTGGKIPTGTTGEDEEDIGV